MVEYDKIRDSNDKAKALDDAQDDLTFDEWKDLVASSFNSGELTPGEKVRSFGLPVEGFCTDHESVDVLGTVSVSRRPVDDILAEVEHVVDMNGVDRSETVIGVHETTMENANKILDEGVKPYKEQSNNGNTIRDGSVFFWVHATDVGEMARDYPDGIVVAAPIESTKVSSFLNADLLISKRITADEYDNHHAVDYTDYVEALESGSYPSRTHTADTLF